MVLVVGTQSCQVLRLAHVLEAAKQGAERLIIDMPGRVPMPLFATAKAAYFGVSFKQFS